jgi:hypothetical protein
MQIFLLSLRYDFTLCTVRYADKIDCLCLVASWYGTKSVSFQLRPGRRSKKMVMSHDRKKKDRQKPWRKESSRPRQVVYALLSIVY